MPEQNSGRESGQRQSAASYRPLDELMRDGSRVPPLTHRASARIRLALLRQLSRMRETDDAAQRSSDVVA